MIGRIGLPNIVFHAFVSSIFALCVTPASAESNGSSDPIHEFVGRWDIPGTLTSIEIRDDHSVQHSHLGAGDIKQENADYYEISYRANFMQCRYEIKKYSENELSMVLYLKTDSADCELGILKRTPERSRKSESAAKSEEDLAQVGGEKSKGGEDRARISHPTMVFKDCQNCPDLVVIPAGEFLMGSPDSESGRRQTEGPLHKVSLARAFAPGRYAVTVDQFRAFVAATNFKFADHCREEKDVGFVDTPGRSFLDPGFPQDGSHPVVCVSSNDASEYVKWLSSVTHKKYRLLSEAEREYVARAGTSTPYWWGSSVTPDQANYDSRVRSSAAIPLPLPIKANRKTATASAEKLPQASGAGPLPSSLNPSSGGTMAVQKFGPNLWGMFQVHGNAAEWVQDCWNPTYIGAPSDGAPAITGDCSRRVLRGGAWSYWPEDIRSASRDAAKTDERYVHVGFRIARDLQN